VLAGSSGVDTGVGRSSLTPASLIARLFDAKEYVLERSVRVRQPLKDVFPFFAAAENLQAITPPELGFRIRTTLPIEMKRGALIDYTIKLHGIPMKWRTEITAWNPPHAFEDVQLRGPYAKWVHTHTFVEEPGGTRIDDRVVYALPFAPLGRIVHPFVARQLDRIFNYRREVLASRFHVI
jgi:ligand-binding SRPBCC domain-containing protein